MDKDKGQILLYQTPDGEARIEVRLEGETVWLNLEQIAELFQIEVQALLSQETVSYIKTREDVDSLLLAEKKRIERGEKRKKTFLSGIRICICYVLLLFVLWIIFCLCGMPNYIWLKPVSNYVFFITFGFSLIVTVFLRPFFGYCIFLGLAVGILAGNLTGFLTTTYSSMHFNLGWFALFISLAVSSIIGIIITFLREKHISTDNVALFSIKIRRRVLIFSLIFIIAFIVLGIYTTSKRFAFNNGAKNGYDAGFEAGKRDKQEGRAPNNTLGANTAPDSYKFGTASFNGYMIYWPAGYQDGYSEGR